MKEGRKPEYPDKIPDDELQKIPHILQLEDSSPKRDSNPRMYRWQARKADMLTVTLTIMILASKSIRFV